METPELSKSDFDKSEVNKDSQDKSEINKAMQQLATRSNQKRMQELFNISNGIS